MIIVGENVSDSTIEDFGGKKVINLECPVESDLLIRALEKCTEFEIKTDLFFTTCTISGINTLMSTLFMNLEGLYLVNCSSALINPHVLESLELDFNVKIIR